MSDEAFAGKQRLLWYCCVHTQSGRGCAASVVFSVNKAATLYSWTSNNWSVLYLLWSVCVYTVCLCMLVSFPACLIFCCSSEEWLNTKNKMSSILSVFSLICQYLDYKSKWVWVYDFVNCRIIMAVIWLLKGCLGK